MPDSWLGSTFKTNRPPDIFTHFCIFIFTVILPAGKSSICKSIFLYLNEIETRKQFIICCFWKYVKWNTNILIIINIHFTNMPKRMTIERPKPNKRPKRKMKIYHKFYLGIWMKSRKSLYQNVSGLGRRCIGTYLFFFFFLLLKEQICSIWST